MADPIRVGIVEATVTLGGSGWGANAHVPALQALPDYELRAVCTAHEETAAAAAARFGAKLAFHDIDDMVARPEDIDLLVVSVRVPWHYDLVMASLRAGKPVFCEWPLGVSLEEAEEMANFARERELRTAVGLQARSDPSVRYAHDLIAQGYVGRVLTANLSVIARAVLERCSGRLWQAVRANGANPLTIAGGHAIDALCCILGEVVEISARVTTRITEWRDEESGAGIPVDAPDRDPRGQRACPFYRHSPRDLRRRGGALPDGAVGEHRSQPAARLAGSDQPAELAPPDEYLLAREGTSPGPPRNVAHAYARMADALAAGEQFNPDFDLAVRRHRLLGAIERSSESGLTETVSG